MSRRIIVDIRDCNNGLHPTQGCGACPALWDLYNGSWCGVWGVILSEDKDGPRPRNLRCQQCKEASDGEAT